MARSIGPHAADISVDDPWPVDDDWGMETPAHLEPWSRVRHVAGLACIILLLIFAASLLYYLGGFLYFWTTGSVPRGYIADELEWKDLGSFLLGWVFIVGALLAGAWYLIPETVDEIETAILVNQSRPETDGSGAASLPSSAAPPPGHPARQEAADQDVGLQSARQGRGQDQQMLDVVRSDPQMAAIEYLLQRLLSEQEMRARSQAIENERRTRRHDLVLMGTGTVLGVIAPVLTAPLLGKLPL